jgi:hypothetical protein
MPTNWPQWITPAEQDADALYSAASEEWGQRPAPWVGGVISALAWVRGHPEGPYSSGDYGTDEYYVGIELDVAHRQATDGPMPDHRDYGAAVRHTLEWLRGTENRPVPLRCDYYDDSEVAEEWRAAALAVGNGSDVGWVSDYGQLAQLVHDTRSRAEDEGDEVDD